MKLKQFLSERELKKALRDTLTRAAWLGPSNFLFVRSEHALASYPGADPGARFSKDPVTTGPDNLPGRLTGNFTGPEIEFLEAPVNFPRIKLGLWEAGSDLK